jgi:hypothetical protein
MNLKMEEIFEYSRALAETLWGLATINQKELVEITLSNTAGDEIYITAQYGSNGISCHLTFFSDGIVLSREVLDGGSYEILVNFLTSALDVEDKPPYHFPDQAKAATVLTYSQFIGDKIDPKKVFGTQINDFEDFKLDQEVEQIIMDDPTVAMHE